MRSMVSSSRSLHDAQSWNGVRRALGRQVRKLRNRSGSVTRAAGRTRRSALDPHQRHRAGPVRPEAQHADPRVTRPRGELVCSLRRDCCAASTSEAFALRGHGCAFLAPSTSVIEGSCDISEVDVHLCRGCAIAAAELMKRCRRARPPRIRPVGRNERRRTRCGAPEAAQHADQDVDEGAHATLEAARGPEARRMAHEQSQIQTADVHQQAPEDVRMAAQMEPAQSAGFVEMRALGGSSRSPRWRSSRWPRAP